jgi:hypothetical protein
MCYNHPAVKGARKQEFASPRAKPAGAVSEQAANEQENANAVAASAPESEMLAGEDPSRYCPVCSRRLESRRCKLICPVCGYYMSCADYY